MKNIAYGAFSGCSSLSSIVFDENSQLKGIDCYAFSGCSSLTNIEIPDSVKGIAYGAFEGCSSLSEVHISSIEAWCNITFIIYGGNPLSYANNLYLNGGLVTELVIPDNVTSIGDCAFDNCDSITSVVFGENSQLTSIGHSAFYRCSNLESIMIPDSVTSIGELAFSGCSSLENVYYCGTPDKWDDISMESQNSELENATRYYYSETAPFETAHKYWHYVDGVPTVWD